MENHHHHQMNVRSSTPLLEEHHQTCLQPRIPSFSEVLQEVKELYAIAIPLIVTSLLTYAKSATSTLFLGQIGKKALAGGSLATCVANITGYSVVSGLSLGMEGISSQAHGASNSVLLGKTLRRTILFLFASCLPISVLWLCAEPILLRLGQDPEIVSIAAVYLRLSIPDLFVQLWIHPLRIFLRTQKITSPLMVTAVFGVFVHTPVTYLFVHFLKLGIWGIVLATSVANLTIVMGLLSYIQLSHTCKESWMGWSIDCFHGWMPIIRLAIPSCATVCFEWWWYEIMIILAGYLSDAPAAVATMGIVIQETALIYTLPSSLGQAISTRVGMELGANRPKKARLSSLVGLACALLMGLVAMSFSLIVRNSWAWMFTSDATIAALTVTVLPVVGLSEVGNFPQTAGCSVLRGSSRPNLGTYINTVAFYGVGLGPGYYMGLRKGMGILGLWLGNLAAQLTCAAVMFSVVLRTNWAQQAQKAQERTERSPEDTPPPWTNHRNREQSKSECHDSGG
ncbi:hypothetical protein MLD38_031451 [Melastoma candidum]|uniref:Uncharacterized protein n=1 Tax=Melastoma candidum TaxID=119954 RepID=A0ACB9MPQ9_9MYRT|nr:hypothetical protein MLD38_031451 [Melastoma candidum]